MKAPTFGAALAALTLAAALLASPHAEARDEPSAMWPTSFAPKNSAEYCGQWYSVDAQGFCHANDVRNGVEVGMKFETSTPVQIVGVRIYRTDPGGVRGSLWRSDGTLLARGSFAAQTSHGWQDMAFAQPVVIDPGQVYVVSYYTPGTRYAFQYGYYDQARTVGPITALKATDASPNGVFCYDDAACGSFPTNPWKSSTYFVSPLWTAVGAVVDPPTTIDPTSGPAPTTSSPTNPQTGEVDTTAPRVSRVPSGRIAAGGNLAIRFSESVQPASLTSKTVRLTRRGRTVRTSLRYSSGDLVVDPKGRLRAGKYQMVVTSGVRDLAGNRLDQDPGQRGQQSAKWTVRVR